MNVRAWVRLAKNASSIGDNAQYLSQSYLFKERFFLFIFYFFNFFVMNREILEDNNSFKDPPRAQPRSSLISSQPIS